MRAGACSCLDRARLARAGVLDRLGLVEDDQRATRARASQGSARQHAVGGDDQVDAGRRARARRRRARAPASPTGARRSRVSVGREALDLRLPVGEQRGRHHQEVAAASPLARVGCFACSSRSASTWIVLPRPMSSARQAPRPSARQEAQPAHAGLLVGPQLGAQRRRRRRRPGRPGRAAASSVGASHAPAATRDQSARPSGSAAASPSRDRRAGQQPHALEERQPALARLRARRAPSGRAPRRSFSRSSSTHLPFSRTSPPDDASSSAQLGGR